MKRKPKVVTRRELIQLLEGLPLGDNDYLNVSLDNEDIYQVLEVKTTVSPYGFCLDFIVSDSP